MNACTYIKRYDVGTDEDFFLQCGPVTPIGNTRLYSAEEVKAELQAEPNCKVFAVDVAKGRLERIDP